MKTINNILTAVVGLASLAFLSGCNDGIDPISPADPGTDQTAPAVTIKFPSVPKITIPFTDTKTNLDFEYEVSDDIEIKTIAVTLDGTKIKEYTSFKDYRRLADLYRYPDVGVGDHTLTIDATDMSGKTTSKSFDFEITNVYEAQYDGEIFYMPFEGGLYTDLIGKSNASPVGSPGFADGKLGKAYSGETGEYLTFPTDGLVNEEFSAAFWYKPNSSPDRSGILTIGPPDDVNPSAPNNRVSGFRLFREGGASNQTIKLNVGNGTADSWFDGGAAATIDPATSGWVHVAFTISGTNVVVYLNGVAVSQGDFTGVDWTGCDVLSIASGAPRFMEWGHLSDISLYDELRIFNKAISVDEVLAVMNGD